MSGASAIDRAQAEREQWIALSVYGLAVVLVILLAVNGQGMLQSPARLDIELRGDELGPWGMGRAGVTPFCYRPLFRWIVLGAWMALPAEDPFTAFYGVFVAASALSLLAAAGALHALLLALAFSPRQALAGGLLFLSGFPVLFAHDIPIQTREDFLGYACIALGLLAVIKERRWAVLALAALAPWIRETTLLFVLPVWFVWPRPARERLAPYAVGALSLVLVRVVQGSGESGGYLWDLVVASTGPARRWPGEALLYLFASFGAVWVAAGLRLLQGPPWRHPLLSPRIVGLALLAVAVTGWTMGMIRENRITYVLAPLLVPLALELLASERLRRIARARAAWGAASVVLALGAVGFALLRADSDRVDLVRPAIGECFHLGVAPQVELIDEEEEVVTIDLVWSLSHEAAEEGPDASLGPDDQLHASPLQGPHVLLHLAASAFLLAGWIATRGAGTPVEERARG